MSKPERNPNAPNALILKDLKANMRVLLHRKWPNPPEELVVILTKPYSKATREFQPGYIALSKEVMNLVVQLQRADGSKEEWPSAHA